MLLAELRCELQNERLVKTGLLYFMEFHFTSFELSIIQCLLTFRIPFTSISLQRERLDIVSLRHDSFGFPENL